MDYNIINNIRDFEKLENVWKNIQYNDSCHTFFSTFDYCKECVKNLLDKNNQIFVVTVIHNNEIIAIAPLRIETVENFFYSTRIIKFLSIGDYNSFLFNESLNIKYDNVYFEIFKAIDEKIIYGTLLVLT